MTHIVRLSLWEIKKSYLQISLAYITSFILAILLVTLYQSLESPDPYHDLILLFMIIGTPYMFRRKIFKVPSDKGIEPAKSIIYFQELPIKRQIIALSQVLIFVVYHLPSYFILLTTFYLFDDHMKYYSLNEFLIILITLIMGSFLFAMINFVSDFGIFIHRYIYYMLMIVVGIIVITIWLRLVEAYKEGVFMKLIQFIIENSSIAISVSLAMMIGSLIVYPLIMIYKMKKIDY